MESDNDKMPGKITIDTLENLDFDIIQDMPWAQKLWDQVQDHTKKGFLNWCNIVRKLVGPKAEHVKDWSEQYGQAMDETCCNLVYDLVHLQSKKMHEIQELVARLQQLSIELHPNMPQKMSETDLSLFEEQNRLRKQINDLEEMKKSTVEEISQLRVRIEELWKMLDIDLMYRDEFKSHYTGNSIDTLDALRIEVKRCAEIRQANIKIFVDKLRVQLQDLWKKCHCTDSVRRSFSYFKSDCYTEELLDRHEMEIKKWKNSYEENSRLLGLLEKHGELWEKAVEFEENAAGQNRLKNRGGKLLQEEKERNKLTKLITKIQEEIRTLSEDYRIKNNGASFTSFGRTPEECIDILYAERQNTRQLKLSDRKMQRSDTVRPVPAKSPMSLFPPAKSPMIPPAKSPMIPPAKSPMSLFPSTSTAVTPTMSATKPKTLATPNTENIERLKEDRPKSMKKPTGTLTLEVPRIKVTLPTMPSLRQKLRSMAMTSMERCKRHDVIRKKSGRAEVSIMKARRNTLRLEARLSADRQTELSSREQGPSTILPEEIHKTSAASSSRIPIPKNTTPENVFATPMETPASVYKNTTIQNPQQHEQE